jgi:molybdopterin-containing oxidoreductase family membrane subunit
VPTLVAVFDQPMSLADAARRLKKRGYAEMEIYAPAAFRELEDLIDEKPSRVRLFTLIGGLVGVVTGYAMTIWMANDWPIMLGGKPFSSIPPYTIIGFELTILFGGLMTALGLFVVGGLPSMRLDPHYDARFSAEDFGVSVRCRDRDVSEIDALLRSHGAREVTLAES